MAVWTATVSIMDAKGDVSRHLFYIPFEPMTDIDNALRDPSAFAQAYALELEPLIDGFVTSIILTLTVDLLPGHKTSALAHSDVNEGALFIWRTQNGFTFKHRIPTFKESLLESNSNAVDLIALNGVSQYESMMILGGSTIPDWQVSVSDSREDYIVGISTAEQNFKKSRP